MPPIAAGTPYRNHRPRKKPRRSDPTSSPPSLSDGRLPQKAFQSQSLNRPKTPYPGRYNLVTIGVLEFVVVIDVYAQPTREKIKFYRTASNTTVELAGRSGVWRSVVSSGRLWRRPDGPGARATMRE